MNLWPAMTYAGWATRPGIRPPLPDRPLAGVHVPSCRADRSAA